MAGDGTFLPMFRSHGTDTPREIWNFGEKGTMVLMMSIEKFIKLRYHLMPYIYSLAGAVHFNDYTIMRKPFSLTSRRIKKRRKLRMSLCSDRPFWSVLLQSRCITDRRVLSSIERKHGNAISRQVRMVRLLDKQGVWRRPVRNRRCSDRPDADLCKSRKYPSCCRGTCICFPEPEESVKLMVYPGEDC